MKDMHSPKTFLFIYFLFIGSMLTAQNSQKPCSAPETTQFDFWIGDWNLYTADTLTGTNSIYKVMGGCTIQENFEDPKKGYSGKSWSVYNPQIKQWQQTWVDNTGSYISLNGVFENGVMTLTTGARKMANGKNQVYRMRFHHITKDGFEWDWESTKDNGATWLTGWHIRYERKK